MISVGTGIGGGTVGGPVGLGTVEVGCGRRVAVAEGIAGGRVAVGSGMGVLVGAGVIWATD